MNPRARNLAVGVGIPSAGSVVFNLLTQMARGGAHAALGPSDFDFSFGCALAIVGVAVAQRDAERSRDLFVVFTMLLLILLATDIIFRVQNPAWEPFFVALSDTVAFATTFWAMME